MAKDTKNDQGHQFHVRRIDNGYVVNGFGIVVYKADAEGVAEFLKEMLPEKLPLRGAATRVKIEEKKGPGPDAKPAWKGQGE